MLFMWTHSLRMKLVQGHTLNLAIQFFKKNSWVCLGIDHFSFSLIFLFYLIHNVLIHVCL